MKSFHMLILLPLLGLLAASTVQAQMPATFSYQGYLLDPEGAPVNNTVDLAFALYDNATDGTALWQETHASVPVADGIFTVHLGRETAFDGVAFDGSLWLGVQIDGGDELRPRVALSSVPYSLRAGSLAEQALQAGENIAITRSGEALVIAAPGAGEVGWGRSGNAGTDPSTDFMGTTDAAPLELRVNGSRVMRFEPETASHGPNVVGGWSGNTVSAGIVGATIAGGGDPEDDEIRSPNQVTGNYGTVAGGLGNTAGNAATVGGGFSNTAGNGATVGGGSINMASGFFATIGGGSGNKVSSLFSTVGGGQTNSAGGNYATIGGGTSNEVRSDYSTVGGGVDNAASGAGATVPGGSRNQARGDYSFAAGSFARAAHDGSFVWGDAFNFGDSLVTTAANQFLIRAAGGVGISTDSPTSPLTVAGMIESTEGGFQFPDGTVQTTAASGGGTGSGTGWQLGGNNGTTASSDFIGTTDEEPLELRVDGARVMRYEAAPDTSSEGPNVIGGWRGNSVAAGVVGATIAGGGDPDGINNVSPNVVTANYGTIGGGQANTAGENYATVGGGLRNTAGGTASTVSGGFLNTVDDSYTTVGGGSSNTAGEIYATVGGGLRNTASGNSATVGGGSDNTVGDEGATVSGGSRNTAGEIYATVGGGLRNTARGSDATVPGGRDNMASGNYTTVGGGVRNTASGNEAVVGGGHENVASGRWATVPGGSRNQARGTFSFAAGFFARAAHTGSFVWNGGSIPNDSLVSTADRQFLIRAIGGVGIGTNAPQAAVHIAADSGPNPHLLLEENNNTDFARLRLKNTSSSQFWDVAAGAANTEHLNFFVSNSRGNVMSLRASGDPLVMHNGAKLTAGGTWTNASSRALKTDFALVDEAEVLARLSGMPVQTWRYKAESGVRHMGPTAEAFAEAFGLGDTDKAIATVDADGVALAAIQALYERVQAQEQLIMALVGRLEALER